MGNSETEGRGGECREPQLCFLIAEEANLGAKSKNIPILSNKIIKEDAEGAGDEESRDRMTAVRVPKQRLFGQCRMKMETKTFHKTP